MLCATTFLILYRYFNQQNNTIENAEKQITEYINLKIPGYAPKYALQFKKDLKNREKEDKKNTNSHSESESSYLDGGEQQIYLNTDFGQRYRMIAIPPLFLKFPPHKYIFI